MKNIRQLFQLSLLNKVILLVVFLITGTNLLAGHRDKNRCTLLKFVISTEIFSEQLFPCYENEDGFMVMWDKSSFVQSCKGIEIECGEIIIADSVSEDEKYIWFDYKQENKNNYLLGFYRPMSKIKGFVDGPTLNLWIKVRGKRFEITKTSRGNF